MSEGQLFRLRPAIVCPPPPPDERVSFQGDAYPPPQVRIKHWVWRKPKSQRALIEAKKSRRKPPKTKPERDPNVIAYDDEYFEQVRREEKEKLFAKPAPETQDNAPPEPNAEQAPVPQGTWSTPDQWNKSTQIGRKAVLKKRGTFKSSSGAALSSRSKKPMGVNMRQMAIPSGRDKAKTGQKAAIAAKRETKRSLAPAEIEAAYEPVATSAIARYKANRVANLQSVLFMLQRLISPTDGREASGLLAYTIRFMRNAVGADPSDERIIDKRFLHSAATKALGELIKHAWWMMDESRSKDVTDDLDARRRVESAKRRLVTSPGEFMLRRHQMEDGHKLLFLLTVERSGRVTLHWIKPSKR